MILQHTDITGLTIYAKPSPLQTDTWGSDDVALTEVGTTGVYESDDVSSPASVYVVFEQAGGSEAITDEVAGTISVTIGSNTLGGALTVSGFAFLSDASVQVDFLSRHADTDFTDTDNYTATLRRHRDGSITTPPESLSVVQALTKRLTLGFTPGETWEAGDYAVIDVTVDSDTARRVVQLRSAFMPTSHISATGGKVDGVATVDTTTTNTDMRGTDGANTTAPDNAGITAIKAKTDNLPAEPAAVGSEMTLDMTQATPGESTVGEQLDAAGTGGGGGTTKNIEVEITDITTGS